MRWIKEAKYLEDYKIQVTFDNGDEFPIDFQPHLQGPIFEPLKDKQEFRKFRIHPELDVITWENGADFAPDFLYEVATGKSKVTAS